MTTIQQEGFLSDLVEDHLKEQGLSLSDVGIHRATVKKQCASWEEFPRPRIEKEGQILVSLNSERFANVIIEFFSHQDPNKKTAFSLALADIGLDPFPIDSTSNKVQIGSMQAVLDLTDSDQQIDLKLTYEAPYQIPHPHQTLSFSKGTKAALCFHFGGENPEWTSQLYHRFSLETDETKRLYALLNFVGASYFENCGWAEEKISALHKIPCPTALGFGLAQLTSDKETVSPQVDMFWFIGDAGSALDTTAHYQYATLATVNQSSHEHQIIKEIFNDDHAISTVKLLHLAYGEENKGLGGDGFITLTASSLEAIDKAGELAKNFYFPYLRTEGPLSSQWAAIQQTLALNPWGYAYMTPGPISSTNGACKEAGSLPSLTPKKCM